MNDSGRNSIDREDPKDQFVSGETLGLTFTSESDLDDALWFDPENAGKDLHYLLKVHAGEMSPALSRLALKAVTLPLFIREFQGEDTTLEIEDDVQHIALRNSILLDAYMERVNDDEIDQNMLNQAINDATVLQLIARSFRSKESDDTILLPIGPDTDYIAEQISFTVLRRKSLGRAVLHVSNSRPIAYMHTPQMQPHRILIRPDDIVGTGSIHDLAEALISEQSIEPMAGEDHDLISAAAAHVHTKIAQHFDRIQPQS